MTPKSKKIFEETYMNEVGIKNCRMKQLAARKVCYIITIKNSIYPITHRIEKSNLLMTNKVALQSGDSAPGR